MKLSMDLWSLNVFILFWRANVCVAFQRLKGYDLMVCASANCETIAFHIKRQDLEKYMVQNILSDHKASCHRKLYSKGLASFQIIASRAIVIHDAVAPTTPSSTGGLKVKYNVTFVKESSIRNILK